MLLVYGACALRSASGCARETYDDRVLYVGVRCFDVDSDFTPVSHPVVSFLQAAILQQTAEYIYSLEQEKTRLLSQNCQLKRLLSLSQQQLDTEPSSPPPPTSSAAAKKRKNAKGTRVRLD